MKKSGIAGAPLGASASPPASGAADKREKSRRGRRRSQYGVQAGFTLLEVLIALTILAVGILTVMRLFPMALVQQRRAAERTVIASLARTQLSEVRTGGVGQSLVSWLQSNSYKVVEQAARSYTLYDSWRTSVTRMGQPDVDLYRVVFTVRMHDGRDEDFVTYVTER